MSLADDLLKFFDRVESDPANSVVHQGNPFAVLAQQPEFHELKERVEKLSTPDLQMLLCLRALAAQQAVLAPKLIEAALVVSFPDNLQISARHTAQVVRDMITNAREEILIAGFAINKSGGLPELLLQAAKRVPRIVLLCSDWKSSDGTTAKTLFSEKWPAGCRRPDLFEYKSPNGQSGMHIKCLIVDGTQMLIGSANFTFSGMKRNFEMGVWIKGEIARAARGIFTEFLNTGRFDKLP